MSQDLTHQRDCAGDEGLLRSATVAGSERRLGFAIPRERPQRGPGTRACATHCHLERRRPCSIAGPALIFRVP
eukprot:scaffold3804_cov381-Prasinococcus_capsulatus_cf.AAC.8